MCVVPILQLCHDKFESVQRRSTKRLHGFHDIEYPTRLNKLNLQSLEYRRLVADLILAYKIIFGLVDIDPNDYFCLKGSRGDPYKITVGLMCVETFFSEGVVLAWNSLPPSVANFTSLRVFKKL